jgi:hypothetical protein
MSKYFISASSLTLSIIFIAINELQSLIDAVLYDTKKTILVSIHPAIHPMPLQPIANPCPHIISASKLFYSVLSAVSCDTGKVCQHILLHLLPI